MAIRPRKMSLVHMISIFVVEKEKGWCVLWMCVELLMRERVEYRVEH